MQNINVGRYSNPQDVGWQGWLEPSDKSWIAFIDLYGKPVFYLYRNSQTGAVMGEDVTEGTKKRVPAGVIMPPEPT